MNWKLAEAKTKLSEVVNLALSEGPQKISRRNDAFIILSEKDYKKLTGEKMSFSQMLMAGAALDELDLSSDRSPAREIDLI